MKGLFQDFGQRMRGAWGALTKNNSWTQAWLAGKDGTIPGSAMLVSAFQQSTWVYACITTLAECVAHVPFRILSGQEDDETELMEGLIVDLFRRPHRRMDRYQFWELIVSWLALRGEAFIVPHSPLNTQKRIDELVILNPDRFVEVLAGNELMGWRYTAGIREPLESQVFLPEEVIHLRLSNPYNFWRGLSPLSVAQLAAQSDYAAAQFMKGTLMNNADTGLIVTSEQQFEDGQKEQILAALTERKRKAGAADYPLFLWGGAKVEKPSISAVDLQFLENRKFNRQEICAIYKVPQELLGFTEDANRSVSDAMRLNFMENRIAPLCCRLAAGVQPIIDRLKGPGGGEVRGEFHVKGTPIMQAAQRARIDSGVKLFAMGYPINEINQVLDLGMSEQPHGDKAYLPFSLQEVGTGTGVPATAPAAQEEDKAGLGYGVALRQLREVAASAGTPAARHVCGAGDDKYAAEIEGSIKNKKGKLGKFFIEQRARVLAKLATSVAANAPAAQTKALEDIFDLADENKILWGRLSPLLRGDLIFGAAQIAEDLGLADFDLPPQAAIDFLNTREKEIKAINDQTFEQLKGTLQEGLGVGETMAELADRVREVYNATEGRAETIALTETTVATNSGRFAGMKTAGVEKKGWGASNLANVRPAHAAAAAAYASGIGIDEAFLVGGEALQHPGDPAGSAANVVNCRCYVFAIIGEKGKS